MYNVTLISTAHTEIGRCNARELLRIIEQFKPEVIFEELSSSAYNECYGENNRITLETSAIKMYLQNHKIEHNPVVGSELPKDFDSKFEILIKNDKFLNLTANLLMLEEKYGFQFLNSKLCEELFEKLRALEKLILVESDDKVLTRIYQLGIEAVDAYENEIIGNVYHYSFERKFNRALLFLGAAHRKSIRKKIQEYGRNENKKLNWTFYDNQDFSFDEKL